MDPKEESNAESSPAVALTTPLEPPAGMVVGEGTAGTGGEGEIVTIGAGEESWEGGKREEGKDEGTGNGGPGSNAIDIQGQEVGGSVAEPGKDQGAGVNEEETEVFDPYRHMSAEELVAKCRAPVKRMYLLPPTPKKAAPAAEGGVDLTDSRAPKEKERFDKKSKRQLKKERNQLKTGVGSICIVVAKAGRRDACPYGDSCRFNHDIEAYLSQKPPDLPGQCPYTSQNLPCSFGIACRFFQTHPAAGQPEQPAVAAGGTKRGAHGEINSLSRELQKQLWKTSVVTPRADAALQQLGVTNKSKSYGANKRSAAEISKVAEESEDPADASAKKPKLALATTPEQGAGAPAVTATVPVTVPGAVPAAVPGAVPVPGVTFLSVPAVPGGSATELPESNSESHLAGAGGASEARYGDAGRVGDDEEMRVPPREKTRIDFRGQLYLAPLTTVGNLPFRRVCKGLGADVTCGEMALCTNLLQGQASEWALLRKHESEKLFGVQICGSHPDQVARTAEIVERECQVDFVDINMGCPIDLIVNKGAGSFMLTKPQRLEACVRAASAAIDAPLTVKIRTAYVEGKNVAHTIIPQLRGWGAHAVTLHGRSRQQRYSKTADWDYIRECARTAPPGLQVLGNGDVFSYNDWNEHMTGGTSAGVASCMLARGVLVKPWVLTEIKEQRVWDISSSERLDILKDFSNYGLLHWGSDTKGVETTRRFLLDWLGYLHRYVPAGLLEVLPQKLNWRPPAYFGRNDLETLMASDIASDWVKISEMLLGPAPEGFTFVPKHKSNSYDKAENG